MRGLDLVRKYAEFENGLPVYPAPNSSAAFLAQLGELPDDGTRVITDIHPLSDWFQSGDQTVRRVLVFFHDRSAKEGYQIEGDPRVHFEFMMSNRVTLDDPATLAERLKAAVLERLSEITLCHVIADLFGSNNLGFWANIPPVESISRYERIFAVIADAQLFFRWRTHRPVEQEGWQNKSAFPAFQVVHDGYKISVHFGHLWLVEGEWVLHNNLTGNQPVKEDARFVVQ